MPELLCPYCARPPAEDRGLSRDDIFIKAMGARATVTACKECNDRIGRDVEGRLQRPGTLLNLIKQTKGGGRKLPGVSSDGRKAKYDLTTHELDFMKPVHQLDQGTIRYSSSPDHVRKLLSKQGLEQAEIDLEMSKAQNVTLPEDTWINTEIMHDHDLADRLVAKVALGAGAFAGDHAFIVSDLARLLRSRCSQFETVLRPTWLGPVGR